MSGYVIRNLREEELDALGSLGEQFTRESRYVKFSLTVFKHNWAGFLQAGIGTIFVAEDDDGKIAGAIGALKFNEPNSGVPMANELFWIVAPEHRGGCGVLLLNRLEKWAKSEGCRWLWMNYLIDSMPEKVKGIYEKKGFKIIETHWAKELET